MLRCRKRDYKVQNFAWIHFVQIVTSFCNESKGQYASMLTYPVIRVQVMRDELENQREDGFTFEVYRNLRYQGFSKGSCLLG